MTRRQKKIIGILSVPVLAVMIGAPVTLHTMASKDRQHAQFYNTGKTINDFLYAYCGAIKESLKEGKAEPLMRSYSANYASPERGAWDFGPQRFEGDIAVYDLEIQGSGDSSRGQVQSEYENYLGELSAIDQTICKIDLIEDIELEKAATLTVKQIVYAKHQDGSVIEDRMFYRWSLRNEGDAGAYDWKIVKDELVEGVRVMGDRKALASLDPPSVGVDFVHRRDPKLEVKEHGHKLKFGVIEHASGGISTADYDLDGKHDLFFLGGEESRLYRNEGFAESPETASDGESSGEEGMESLERRPHFRDVTAEVGLEGIDQAHAGLFADFDNDGDRDLFVGRYYVDSFYYENRDGKFHEKGAGVGLNVNGPITSVTLLDYDKDGYLDIYLAMNGNAFEALPRLPFYAQNGQPNRLYKNEGGKSFRDVTEEAGVGDIGWSLATAAADYDGDGWTDIGVANDFGRKNLYRNNGDGTFTETAKEAGVLDFSGGMGLTFGDFDDDGNIDLYTSNINSNQRWFGEDMTVSQYIRNVMRTRWIFADYREYIDLYGLIGSDWVELGQQIGEGNSLFRNAGKNAAGETIFEELKDSHTGRAGWGWSVNFFDLDNDTDLDLYAANGWVSNTPGTDL